MALSTLPVRRPHAAERQAPTTTHAQIDAALRRTTATGPTFDRRWLWPALFATGAWSLVALLFHDPLYDVAAAMVGATLLAGFVAFVLWQAPNGREDYRILGLFVCGQGFMTSGLSVVGEVDTRYLRFVPTSEAFSFSIYSFVIFSFMFLAGAWLTSPRDPARAVSERSALPPGTALWLSVGAAVVGMALAYGSRPDSVWRIGTLPGVLLNLSVIAPLVLGSGFVTGRPHRLALGLITGSLVLRTFLTSTLAGPIFFVRDVLLTFAYFAKRPPWRWFAVVAVAAVILNPAKGVFRELQVVSGSTAADAESVGRATELWGEALSATWSDDDPRARERGDHGSASKRLDYNWLGAHVYTMVPSKVPFQEGETYEDIPVMLVPRLLYPDKPTSAGHFRARWLVRLGVQDPDNVHLAAVALPAPAEAYWNFGWFGVFAVPTLYGALTGLLMRFRPRDPVARGAFTILLVTTVAQFLDMLVWVIPQFFVVIVSSGLILFFMWIGRAAFRSQAVTALRAR